MQARPYRSDAEDLPPMLRLIQRRWIESAPRPSDLHPGDLLWHRFMHEDRVSRWHERVLLWETGDELLGFAEYYPKWSEVGLFLQARLETDRPVVARMLDEVRSLAIEFSPDAPPGDLVVTAFAGTPLESTLDALGLHRQSPHPMRMNALALDKSHLSATPTPDGWTVREVTNLDEYPGRVAVHQAAFAPSKVTLDAYIRLRGQPGYAPQLDLVAVDAEGTLASFALGWLDPVTRTGLIEPVGTLPDFRGRGLARSVLRELLRRFAVEGAERVYVGCLDDNPAACGLYESVGFREVGRWSAFALTGEQPW